MTSSEKPNVRRITHQAASFAVMAGDGEGVSPELRFLEEFSKKAKLIEEDGIQYRTTGCSINETDFEGEVTDWALQYLYSHNCPYALAAAVARVTCAEIKLMDLNNCQLQQNGETHLTQTLDSSKLQQTVHRKVHEICEQWRAKPIMTMEKRHSWPLSVCAVKNSRRRMEDRHVLIPDMNLFFGFESKTPQGFFAVFDGHAGTEAATYASAHLHHQIARHPAFNEDVETAIKEGFKKTDELFVEKAKREGLKCGSTAVCAIVKETHIHLGWVGDSQAFIIRQGVPVGVVIPHIASRDDERERIEKEGGCVVFYGTWRVNGTLAISRAIGDYEYKPYVSSDPDICSVPRDGTEDFILMACDGLWDVTTPTDAAYTVYSCLSKNHDAIDDIAEKLVQNAVQRNSSDNITVIVVFLKDPVDIAKSGIPPCLSESNETPVPQTPKLPEGCVTNGESPTKIPNLWMSDAINQPVEDMSTTDNIADISKSSVDSVSEYFLAPSSEEQKFAFDSQTTVETSTMSTSQVSLSSFDSKGGTCLTPSPDDMSNIAAVETTDVPSPTVLVDTSFDVSETLTDLNQSFVTTMSSSQPISPAVSPIKNVDVSPIKETPPLSPSPSHDVILMASQSSLSPSAPEFIPHGFQFPSETDVDKPVDVKNILDSSKIITDIPKTDADLNREESVEEIVTVEAIPDNVPVAEDVVDDESEDGEGWRYIQMEPKTDENKENVVPQDVVAVTPDESEASGTLDMSPKKIDTPEDVLESLNVMSTTAFEKSNKNVVKSPVKSEEVLASPVRQECDTTDDLLVFGQEAAALSTVTSPESAKSDVVEEQKVELKGNVLQELLKMEEFSSTFVEDIGFSAKDVEQMASFITDREKVDLSREALTLNLAGVDLLSPEVSKQEVVEIKEKTIVEVVVPAVTREVSSTVVEKKTTAATTTSTKGKTTTSSTMSKSKSQTSTAKATSTTMSNKTKTATAKPKTTITQKTTTSTLTKAQPDKKPAPKTTTSTAPSKTTSTLTRTTTLPKTRPITTTTEAKKPSSARPTTAGTKTTTTTTTSTLSPTKKPAAKVDVKTSSSSTLTRTTSRPAASSQGTIRKTTTTTTTTTATMSKMSTKAPPTKDSKDTANKQLSSSAAVRQTRTTATATASRTLSNAKKTTSTTSAPPTSSSSTTLKRTASTPTTTKRPASAPAKGKPVGAAKNITSTTKTTSTNAIKKVDETKKEKGILDEKTKEQLLLPTTPTDGHGDTDTASTPGNVDTIVGAQGSGDSP